MTAGLYIGFSGERRPSHSAVEKLFGRTFDFESPNISLSHSGLYVVVLEAPAPCGVDLEVHRKLRRSVKEKMPDGNTGDFFTLWTRKEAGAKLLMQSGRQCPLSEMLSLPVANGGEIVFLTIVKADFTVSAASFEPFDLLFFHPAAQ